MSDAVRCPDCGHESPAGSASCSHCNFPLQSSGSGPGGPDLAEPEIVIPRPLRRRRPRPVANPNALFLWMALGIVRGHGGAILLESAAGQGAVVRVLFPALEAAPDAAGPAGPSPSR